MLRGNTGGNIEKDNRWWEQLIKQLLFSNIEMSKISSI